MSTLNLGFGAENYGAFEVGFAILADTEPAAAGDTVETEVATDANADKSAVEEPRRALHC